MKAVSVCFALLAVVLAVEAFKIGVNNGDGKIHVPVTHKPAFRNRIQNILRQRNAPELASGTTLVPLLGSENKVGEYYVDVYLGNSQQHFTAQLDTGSSDLAIPAATCTTCGSHPDTFYSPTSASTIPCSSKAVACPACNGTQCSYQISYGDGSGFTALVYSDSAKFGGFNFTQYFGAIVVEHPGPGQSSFEPYPVDGIMGFAYGAISEIKAPTVFESLVNKGYINNAFSMCFSPTIGGALTLGGDGGYHSGNYQYTPIIKQEFYNIYLDDVTVSGKSIGVSASTYNFLTGTIVDSGTTLLVLPHKAFVAMNDTFHSLCSSNNLVGICGPGPGLFDGVCVSLTAAQLAAFPPISFTFGQSSKISVSIPASAYLQQGFCLRQTSYALAIADGGLLLGTILGDTFMRNFETLFDVQNNRIGFAPVQNCPVQSQ